MSFANLKRGLTAVKCSKTRLLNPLFGSFNRTPLCFYVTKANNFSQPFNAAKFSNAVQSPYSLNTFRSNSSLEPRKSTGGVYGLVKELGDFREKVVAMIAAKNKDDAENLLRAKYEAVKEDVNAGSTGIEEALILITIARVYLDSANLESVGPVVSMLMEIVVGLRDAEMFMDQILVQMGDVYSALGEFDKAVLVYQRGINILEKRHEKNSSLLEEAYLGMAKSHQSLGKSAKAIEFYRSALTSMESSGGVESGGVNYVVSLTELAKLLLIEGKAEEAEVHFLRVYNITKKLFGEHHVTVAITMFGVATIKIETGDSNEAIRLFRDGLEIMENSSFTGLDDCHAESARMVLATTLHQEGREIECREVLHQCLRVSQKSGKEDLKLAKLLFNLGISHLRSNDYAEAENFLRRSMEIIAKVYKSPQHKMVTLPLLPLAVTLGHLGRYEEAEGLASEALKIREHEFGEDSIQAAEALEGLVFIQSMIIKDDEVMLEKLERLLKIQEKGSGNASKEVRRTLEKMACYLDKLGRKDEVLSLEKRLSTLSTVSKSTSQMFDYFWPALDDL